MVKHGDKVRFYGLNSVKFGEVVRQLDTDLYLIREKQRGLLKDEWVLKRKDFEVIPNPFEEMELLHGDKVRFCGYGAIRYGEIIKQIDSELFLIREKRAGLSDDEWILERKEFEVLSTPLVKEGVATVEKKSRLSWDEYFVEILKIVAKRSGCLSRQVGAVIVKDNRIIATGYNSAPVDVEECCNKGYCIRKDSPSGTNLGQCFAIHGEQNALMQCSKLGVSCEGATIYVSAFPCVHCIKLLINSGIKEIVYLEEYNDEVSKEIARLSGIKTRKY